MRCDDFRANYRAVVSGTALAEDSMQEDWADHLHGCDGCSDWYQEQQVRDRGADPARFPCVHIAYQVTQQCQEHEDPWDCPDYVLIYNPRFDEYGIPIRDGALRRWASCTAPGAEPSCLPRNEICGSKLWLPSADHVSARKVSAARRRCSSRTQVCHTASVSKP
jgi:hypothetical protein